MNNKKKDTVNKPYIIGVLVLTFIFPLISFYIELLVSPRHSESSVLIFGKWFVFYAVGCRLLLAGIRQTIQPAFTAKEIFLMTGAESYPVIRELGFANLCFGFIGIISLFIPSWRIVSAFGSGLYYGLAGLQHGLHKYSGINERFALYTDIAIFTMLVVFILLTVDQCVSG